MDLQIAGLGGGGCAEINIQTGERPSVHGHMNKHFHLFDCNYSPRASS